MKNLWVIWLIFTLFLFFAPRCSGHAGLTGTERCIDAWHAYRDYGHGVLYFHETEAEFARTLSRFINDHPELEVVAMTGDGTGFSGKDLGYFVVTRPRVNRAP